MKCKRKLEIEESVESDRKMRRRAPSGADMMNLPFAGFKLLTKDELAVALDERADKLSKTILANAEAVSTKSFYGRSHAIAAKNGSRNTDAVKKPGSGLNSENNNKVVGSKTIPCKKLVKSTARIAKLKPWPASSTDGHTEVVNFSTAVVATSSSCISSTPAPKDDDPTTTALQAMQQSSSTKKFFKNRSPKKSALLSGRGPALIINRGFNMRFQVTPGAKLQREAQGSATKGQTVVTADCASAEVKVTVIKNSAVKNSPAHKVGNHGNSPIFTGFLFVGC